MKPKRYIIPIFVPHVGCPNDCVFCNQRRISGRTEPATAETVKTETEKALEYIPVGADVEIAFYGGSFTAIESSAQEELLSAAKEYLDAGRVSSIRLSTRPDCIDDTVIERLKRFGVKTVELGAQSMCEDVLLAANRGHTAQDVEMASRRIKSAGLTLILQMMTGLPADTPEKSMETARKIAALSPDGVRVYPTVIVRDTRLYDMWQAGAYREHTVEDAVELCSEIADIFDEAGIPVIRMGLNPTEELSSFSAVGGAYHPALGQLVESRRYLKTAIRLIEEKFGDNVPKTLRFIVPKGQTSTLIGQKKCNAKALESRCGIGKITVTESENCKKIDVSADEI